MFVSHDMSHTGKGKHLGYWITNQLNDPFKSLPWPADFIDLTWDPNERDAVAKYLDSQPDVQHWKGYSFCRLGCKDYHQMGTTDKSDGFYTWPAGFSHYVLAHNVRPPQEFIDHASGKCRQTKVCTPNNRLPDVYPLPNWMTVGAQAKVRMEHDQEELPVGTVVTIHSFVENVVNIELGDEFPHYFHYLRGDFVSLFEPVS